MKAAIKETDWSLDDLLPTIAGPEFDQRLADLEVLVLQAETWRDRLSAQISEDDFVSLVQLYEEIAAYGSRMGGYGSLWFSADTQSQDALAFMGRMDQLFTHVRNRLLFIELWWKQLDDAAAERLLKASGDWRYYLESLRRLKPHTLSEPEEKIVNLKNVDGVEALVTLYDMITNKYLFTLEVDGEVKQMTRAELAGYFYSPSPELRATAYRALNQVYAQDGTVLGQIYLYRIRDWRSENLALRHFETPVSVRNLGNDIPDPVVETLLEVSRQNVDIFQDYFRLKAGWLGVDQLRRFDIYAPLSKVDIEYPYAQAVEMALESFEGFSPLLAEQARRVFDENHIDSQIRPGKDGGAFCSSPLPQLTPWVLINYNGKARAVATLAHELGHAVHSMMAADHSLLTFRSSLPLAETASTFAEMLLTERLLEEQSDPAVRRNILASTVDDAYATVMRQAFFVLFEREAHRLVSAGKTTNELCAAYMDNLKQQFGDAVAIDEGFQWEWSMIPHFYQVPFYCYAYSFGQLLVFSLYQRFKQEGPSFIPHYLKILSYGGSAGPEHILNEAGVDMASAAFWQGGYNVIRGMVEQLAEL